MDADLDTLATALYVKTDDLLKAFPERAPARPKVGIAPRINDAELVTLAVMQAVLGHPNETGGCGSPATIWATFSHTCHGNRATTSGCANSGPPWRG